MDAILRRFVLRLGALPCTSAGETLTFCAMQTRRAAAVARHDQGASLNEYRNNRCARTHAADQRRASPRKSAALAVLGLLVPLLGHAACKVETLDLPVKMVGSRATTTVGINGTQVPLMIDSGAFYSFLTDAAAEQLNLQMKRNTTVRVEGITGRVDTRVTKVEKLELLKGVIPGVNFIVGGNDAGAGTLGIMGRNILSVTDTEYDLAHGVIRFLFPTDDCAKANMAYWAGSTPVTELDLIEDYRSKTPAIRAKAKLNGKEFTALFDTGATTVVTARAARRAGVADADLKPAGSVYGAGRGRADAWMAPFERFELGNEAISHNTLPVADFDIDGSDLLLGIDFFLSHRIYVSKQQSKMYVTYNGGPVFALAQRAVARPDTGKVDTAAPKSEATTADEYARRGAASASRRDYVRALADLDKACELEPTSAAFFAERGAIQRALKHPVAALADFDKALTLDPGQADARLARIELRSAAKDGVGARADLDALDQLLPPQAQMRLSMSTLYLELDQPAQAIVQLNQWLPAHPNEIRREFALNNRCWARAMLGVELDKALEDCDDAVDADAKNANYLDSRGWVYLRLGKYGKALSDFDRSIAVQPQGAWSLYGRGLTKTRLGDGPQGDADLAAARKLLADIDVQVAHKGLVPATAAKP